MSQEGLWLIDVQGRLLECFRDQEKLLASLQFSLDFAALADLPILVTEQVPDRLGTTDKRLKLPQSATLFSKASFSGVKDLDVLNYLESSPVRKWWLCGIETHICVLLTALDLQSQGMAVGVLGDCVGAREPHRHEMGLQRMKQAAIEVAHSESFAYGNMQSSTHPKFKELLELVKQRGL